MNHKRHRTKNQRAGCLECKPTKGNGYGEFERAPVSARKRMIATREELAQAETRPHTNRD